VIFSKKGQQLFTYKTLIGVLTPIVAITLALGVCGVIIAVFIGENPLTVYGIIFRTAMGTLDGWGNVFYRATPLIFTGLAVAFAFQCGLFNIGGEGQMVVGGFTIAWIGFTFTKLPGFLLIPLCMLGGAMVGAIWGAIPGYLKAKLGVHEVVNTIMMNWIAVALTQYFMMTFKPADSMLPQTYKIVEAAQLSRLAVYLNRLAIKLPMSNHLNTSVVVALILVVIIAYVLKRTKLGYEIRAVGFNATAAECAGINVPYNMVMAMAISGLAAGLTGVSQVMGDTFCYRYDIFSGLGFNGMGVSLIGKNTPLGVVLGSILFGILEYGGFSASVLTGNKVPREIIMILKAIILIFVVVSGEITKRLITAIQKKKGGQE
jgi:ABC-type uncharacterized transport system permease subunit